MLLLSTLFVSDADFLDDRSDSVSCDDVLSVVWLSLRFLGSSIKIRFGGLDSEGCLSRVGLGAILGASDVDLLLPDVGGGVGGSSGGFLRALSS